ncbi:glutamine synthetase family protein [Nereida sp. MMG025]|uniref:glutamine synthetase family protein n=1 Tax=Nereida sp. MMG025 TaxID=2909981 RepID=UPI001F47C2CA|nr:glutamine synthetase family protein [Nereida sp. MMG025]
MACVDLNRQWRGKRVAAAHAGQPMALPFSVLNVDIFGADIDGSKLVFETGDADGILTPWERDPVPMPWLRTPSTLIPMYMAGFAGDPRVALIRVLDRFAAKGLRVIAATELEFTLLDADDPKSGAPITAPGVLSLRALDRFEAFFDALYDAAEAMDIPADAAISEAGVGQFEINLYHQDALKTADDTALFTLLVKEMALKHGLNASFAAKPDDSDAGNGMHVHFSVMQGAQNIFDDASRAGSDVLHHAVQGCLTAMSDATLVFAPHGNSYARLIPETHAPCGVGWGYDNRTCAIRIPGGPSHARRIEHRVAGCDANPYLMLAAILGSALSGIEDGISAPPAITGNAYTLDLPRLAPDWTSAIDRFETAATMQAIFDPLLIENLCATKRQEVTKISALPESEQFALYRERL